jgi:hypothetical protein
VILAAWWIGSRRLGEPHRVLTLLGLSAGYLMLFNPRTETNSYVILAPAIAVLAARLVAVESSRVGWMLAALALALGNSGMGNPIWPLTKIWPPVMALAFLAGSACPLPGRRHGVRRVTRIVTGTRGDRACGYPS